MLVFCCFFFYFLNSGKLLASLELNQILKFFQTCHAGFLQLFLSFPYIFFYHGIHTLVFLEVHSILSLHIKQSPAFLQPLATLEGL